MDAWLISLARRNGRRYFVGAIAAVFFVGFGVICPALTAVPARYLKLTFVEYLQQLGIVWACLGVLSAITLTIVRDDLRLLYEWVGDQDDLRRHDEVREVLFRLPWRAMRVMFIGAVPVAPVLAISLTQFSGYETAADYAALGISVAASILAAGFAGIYLLEALCRPPRVLLDAAVPGAMRRRSMGLRLIVAIVASTVYGGLSVGYLATDRATAGREYLFEVFGISIVGGLLVTLLFGPMQVSLLGPIRDLRQGTREVADGRLGTHVPVTTSDELGGLAVSFNEMVEDLRASRARIVSAGNEARRRVERDLHDGAQQRLVLLGLKLSAAERRMARVPEHAEALADARAELDLALLELRELARGIYPTSLTSDGLVGAVGEAVRRAGLPATFTYDGTGRYDTDIETAVYFCCLEALQNAAKHAGPGARATVTLEDADGELRFTVSDDGAGFDSRVEGAGLRNMDDRIGSLGGRVTITSAPGSGTTVRGRVPVTG